MHEQHSNDPTPGITLQSDSQGYRIEVPGKSPLYLKDKNGAITLERSPWIDKLLSVVQVGEEYEVLWRNKKGHLRKWTIDGSGRIHRLDRLEGNTSDAGMAEHGDAGNDKPAVLTAILAHKPKLHYWGGEWRYGGFSDKMLRTLFAIISTIPEPDGPILLETGAGLSTLALLAAKPKQLITIEPDKELRERIGTQIERFGLSGPDHTFIVDRAENVLPEIAKANEPFLDFALIDGGHGMTTVFVSFCYANKILKKGGYLAIDDIQLHSVRQLYLLLKHQPGFRLSHELEKFVIFEKTNDSLFLPNWGQQPFVVYNS